MGQSISSLVFRPPLRRAGAYVQQIDEYFIDVLAIGVCIPVLFIRSERAVATTLLLAHGNADDLKSVRPLVQRLVERLGVNVAAFEYPGYGHSMWLNRAETRPLKPSEAFVYAAADATFDWLLTKQHLNSADIVLYGYSLGSGAAVHLAVRCALEHVRCGGLILHAPIASVVRTVLPRICLTVPLLDMFANVDKIRLINCPVTIVHGMRDEVVPVSCAVQLENAAPSALLHDCLYIEDGRHNNLFLHGTLLFDHMRAFLDSVQIKPAE